MCCDWCCDRDVGGDRIELNECVALVKRTVDEFDFERYGVRVVHVDGRMDARLETWKQGLIDEIIDDVRSATYEP